MDCPICDYAVPEDQLRCPNCGKALTIWKNRDMFAHESYTAGLHDLQDGRREAASEKLFRAVALAPAQAKYLATYGRVLAQIKRYYEAVAVLKEAHRLQPDTDTEAALALAESRSKEAEAGATDVQEQE